MTARCLEQLALDAHTHGESWESFWTSNAIDILAAADAEPGIVDALLSIVTSGDTAGVATLDVLEPAIVLPVDDVATMARADWGAIA